MAQKEKVEPIPGWDDVADARIECHGTAWPCDENCGGDDG